MVTEDTTRPGIDVLVGAGDVAKHTSQETTLTTSKVITAMQKHATDRPMVLKIAAALRALSREDVLLLDRIFSQQIRGVQMRGKRPGSNSVETPHRDAEERRSGRDG